MTQRINFYVVHNCGIKHNNLKVLSIVLACFVFHLGTTSHVSVHSLLQFYTMTLFMQIFSLCSMLQRRRKTFFGRLVVLINQQTVSLYHLGMGSIPSHWTPASQLRLFSICPSSEPHQQILIPSTQS